MAWAIVSSFSDSSAHHMNVLFLNKSLRNHSITSQTQRWAHNICTHTFQAYCDGRMNSPLGAHNVMDHGSPKQDRVTCQSRTDGVHESSPPTPIWKPSICSRQEPGSSSCSCLAARTCVTEYWLTMKCRPSVGMKAAGHSSVAACMPHGLTLLAPGGGR